MFDGDKWQEIWATMRKNKLRTVLTAWGVFWGIFMLVAALGMGNGLRNGVMKNMTGSVFNAVFVWGQRTSKPHAGLRPGRRVRFVDADIDAMTRLEGIEHLAPRLQLGGYRDGTPVVRGDESGAFEIMGDYPALKYVQPMRLTAGRFINELDMAGSRKVAIIGDQVYDTLFKPGEDPIGELIKIRGVAFEVVGQFRPRATGDQADRQGQTIFVPFPSFQRAFNVPNRVNWFAFTAAPGTDLGALENSARALLGSRHKVHPEDKQALGSFNAGKEFRKVSLLFDGIEFLLWLVGVATMLAGALGVSNIMLIAVKERTKEIGIRKALGARPRQIVSLVLTESIALTAVAGYLGMLAGIGVLELVSAMVGAGSGPFASPEIHVEVALVATAILIVAGAVAGIIPARHAARVNPIESLRAE